MPVLSKEGKSENEIWEVLLGLVIIAAIICIPQYLWGPTEKEIKTAHQACIEKYKADIPKNQKLYLRFIGRKMSDDPAIQNDALKYAMKIADKKIQENCGGE